MDKQELLNKRLNLIIAPLYVKVTMYLMVVSFFYNLPVTNYSLKGSNEIRLYDVLGIIICYLYIKNFGVLNYYIKQKLNFKFLNHFLIWSAITLIFTGLFSIFLNRPMWLLQSILYYYHFFVFFLYAVLVSVFVMKYKNFKAIVYILLILIIGESLLVIAQNSGIVPFLWNDRYKMSYLGFLSGTLGPNKIVLGMTMFISFAVSLGIYLQKQLKINKMLLLSAITLSGTVLVITGSRTSYLALIVFAAYFLIANTRKFISVSVVFLIIVMTAISLNLEVVEMAQKVFDDRITNKISDPTVLSENSVDVDQLYEDLGSGRKELAASYTKYLIERPYIIPLGIGFNNRLLIGFSAHNIYLSLINEVGLLGLILYLRWLASYFLLNLNRTKYLKMALHGLVLAMLVTLYFGEHLYVYRPLFGLLGFFLLATVLLTAPRFYYKK